MRRSSPYDPAPAASRPMPSVQRTLHRSWPQRLIVAGGIGLSMVCLTVATFVAYQATRLGNPQRIASADLPNLVEVADDQPQNWLVVGSDSRADTPGNRTDTIMVVRVDPAGTNVDILSFQRDLFVPIAGTNHQAKINSAYGDNDTPKRLIDTIKMDFDIDVNHYVEIDFRTFEGIVDAVGAVSMYFDRPIQDRGSGLFVHSAIAGTPPGCRTLNARDALAFARSRH